MLSQWWVWQGHLENPVVKAVAGGRRPFQYREVDGDISSHRDPSGQYQWMMFSARQAVLITTARNTGILAWVSFCGEISDLKAYLNMVCNLPFARASFVGAHHVCIIETEIFLNIFMCVGPPGYYFFG